MWSQKARHVGALNRLCIYVEKLVTCKYRGGYRISDKGGLLMNNKTSERGGGGVLSTCVLKARFLNKRGGCKPQNPLKLRAKKKEFGQKGGGGGVAPVQWINVLL